MIGWLVVAWVAAILFAWALVRVGTRDPDPCEWCQGWDEVYACAHCGRAGDNKS